MIAYALYPECRSSIESLSWLQGQSAHSASSHGVIAGVAIHCVRSLEQLVNIRSVDLGDRDPPGLRLWGGPPRSPDKLGGPSMTRNMTNVVP